MVMPHEVGSNTAILLELAAEANGRSHSREGNLNFPLNKFIFIEEKLILGILKYPSTSFC